MKNTLHATLSEAEKIEKLVAFLNMLDIEKNIPSTCIDSTKSEMDKCPRCQYLDLIALIGGN